MPLPEDRIRALEARVPIPDGEVVGTFLTRLLPTSVAATADDEEEVGWTSGPDAQILEWHGDPNGDLFAPKGMIASDIDTPDLWQNTDGQATWSLVGSGVASSFPITKDDGTVTYTVDGASSQLITEATRDDNSAGASMVNFVGSSLAESYLDTQASSGGKGKVYAEAGVDYALVQLHATDAASDLAKIDISTDSSASPKRQIIVASDYLELDTTDGGVLVTTTTGGVQFTLSSSTIGFIVDDNNGAGIVLNSNPAGGKIDLNGPSTSEVTLKESASSQPEVVISGTQVIFSGQTATPTSADIVSNGDFAFWFDPSAKTLNVKGRDSGGTIRNLVIGTLT